MNLLSSVRNSRNSKLFFSKEELTQILQCYSIGVSKGNWKDYAILFENKKASFYMFKHTLAHPDCILTKIKKNKKKSIIYNLKFSNKKNKNFNKMNDLIAILKRREFQII